MKFKSINVVYIFIKIGLTDLKIKIDKKIILEVNKYIL